jgi:hypothetical protein
MFVMLSFCFSHCVLVLLVIVVCGCVTVSLCVRLYCVIDTVVCVFCCCSCSTLCVCACCDIVCGVLCFVDALCLLFFDFSVLCITLYYCLLILLAFGCTFFLSFNVSVTVLSQIIE